MIKKEREKERKKGTEEGRRGGKGRKGKGREMVQGHACRNNILCGSYGSFDLFGFVFC